MLARILGVQRTTVNAALYALQSRRVIKTVRGSITLLDVEALRDIACECDEALCDTAGQRPDRDDRAPRSDPTPLHGHDRSEGRAISG